MKIHTLSLSICRYLVVCKGSLVIGREKKVGQHILQLMICFSVGIGVAAFAYSHHIRIFLMCMGTEERFNFDIDNFFQQSTGGVGIRLGFFHPFRLSFNIAAFAYIVVVPILYHKIFKFRKFQDKTVKGKSDQMELKSKSCIIF